ncbi:MAG: hypothetical protein AABX16_00535, partial [Nanoarchaeota archaeon]
SYSHAPQGINLNNQSVNGFINNSGIASYNSCESLYNQILAEFNNAQRCSVDSECVIIVLDGPCSISICEDAYNKNYDITRLKSLTKKYQENNHCEQGCPGRGCRNTTGADVKCANNMCKIIYAQTVNSNSGQTCTSNSQCQAGYICIRFVEGMTNKYGGVSGTPENPGKCILED